jgi:hypothetical protein
MTDNEMVALITLFVSLSVTTITVARTIVKYQIQKRQQDVGGAVGPGVEDRLARIEHAVDAIAVEVERISEGQRFTTQLLAERGRERSALGAGREPQS